ncbi:hypothetical protein Tery_0816 [Trichodesmium erythraeum IMS101]|uniref:Uncharacterized protein n=1 Tax=Trichodesmium erythraeum (strain IMS101) TaxID=203124 RepID=Q117U2_TRIEI|nr:hypothetical protein [Trichodesmium erythraeum GBRTRLIN201]
MDKLYKFGKVWAQTEITVRLAIAYFNWILVHRRKENTAAQRAEERDRSLELERPLYFSHTLRSALPASFSYISVYNCADYSKSLSSNSDCNFSKQT